MYRIMLLTAAGVACLMAVIVTLLARFRVLGVGDTEFIHFIWLGGGAAVLGTASALVGIVLAISGRVSLTVTVSTVTLAAISVSIFVRVLIWGPPF